MQIEFIIEFGKLIQPFLDAKEFKVMSIKNKRSSLSVLEIPLLEDIFILFGIQDLLWRDWDRVMPGLRWDYSIRVVIRVGGFFSGGVQRSVKAWIRAVYLNHIYVTKSYPLFLKLQTISYNFLYKKLRYSRW